VKQIVEAALENVEAESREAVESDATEFGPLQFLYIGCGKQGCSRVDAGLADRPYDPSPSTALRTLVTTAHVGVGELVDKDEAISSDHIAQNIPDEAATVLPPIDLPVEHVDLCLLTVHLDESHAGIVAASVADLLDNTPTIAFTSTDDDARGQAFDRLSNAVNTTVLLDESVIAEGPLGVSETPPDDLSDRLVRDFVTDTVELSTVPGPIGIDYARLWKLWRNGGLAVPSVARLDRRELDVGSISESLVPLARADEPASGWLGYVVGGSTLKLSEFERLRENLPPALDDELRGEGGVLGGRIQENLGDTLLVTAFRMMDSPGPLAC
jgi:hypothetical protein